MNKAIRIEGLTFGAGITCVSVGYLVAQHSELVFAVVMLSAIFGFLAFAAGYGDCNETN